MINLKLWDGFLLKLDVMVSSEHLENRKSHYVHCVKCASGTDVVVASVESGDTFGQ